VTDTGNNDSLASLESALIAAAKELREAEIATSKAQNHGTDMLNRVNDLQKRIDARISDMKAMPYTRQTHWAKRPAMVAAEGGEG
jgi:hypothetical protein